MRKIRELLRLKHVGRSQRQIASSLCVAVGTVCGHLRRARETGMTWERAQEMTDTELESALFRDCGRNVAATRAAIDYGHVHVHGELHRDGVTLQLLWSEYLDSVAARGDGTKPYQYSQFCELYGAWRSRLQPSMPAHCPIQRRRAPHPPGRGLRNAHGAIGEGLVDHGGRSGLRVLGCAVHDVR